MHNIKLAVASLNKAKVGAVAAVIEKLEWDTDIQPMNVESGVSAQPMTLEETKKGAVNRAQNALQGDRDMAIGLEGGVFMMEDGMYLCNWGALATSDGRVFTAAGAQIPLPKSISAELLRGRELGPVMDIYANESGIRNHKGAIGVLTNGMMNRDEMFDHLVTLLIGQYVRDSD